MLYGPRSFVSEQSYKQHEKIEASHALRQREALPGISQPSSGEPTAAQQTMKLARPRSFLEKVLQGAEQSGIKLPGLGCLRLGYPDTPLTLETGVTN